MLFQQFNEYRPNPVYNGALMRPGNVVTGPAVVEEHNTTVVVFPDFELELSPLNAYIMRRIS